MSTFQPTPLSTDAKAMRARLRSDGYLLLRALLPTDDIAAVWREVARIAKTLGWLDKNEPLENNVARQRGFCVDPEPEYLALLDQVNRDFSFNALSHHPVLLSLFETLLEGEVLVHPKPLLRMVFPQRDEYTTPAHQDYPNIQGTRDFYTAWIPLMDCDRSCGGLSVAKESHRNGVLDFDIANGAGGIEICTPLSGQWVMGEFIRGDVLIFHSMTVHKGVPNTGTQLRMSMDCRYQRTTDDFNPNNADAPNGSPRTWDDVYASWTDRQREQLAYYWRRFALRHKPFDPQWFDRRDALAFTLGEQGDPRARSVLLRIAARDSSPSKRAQAKSLLAALPLPSASQ